MFPITSMGRTNETVLLSGRSFAERRFLNFAAADAGCADANTCAGPVHKSMDRLQIQIPAALGDIVGVTDAMPELRPAATDFTNFSHKNTPWPSKAEQVKH
jgi:hypothetical protein